LLVAQLTPLELRGELARGREFARRVVRLLRLIPLVAATGVALLIAFLATGRGLLALVPAIATLIAVGCAGVLLYALGRWRQREYELLRQQRQTGGRA
jgi:hypothetical protein